MNDHRVRDIPVRASSTDMSNYGGSYNSNNPDVHISPVPPSYADTNRPTPMNTVSGALSRCGRKVEEATIMADNFWNHIRISSNLADAAMARFVQGTKVLTHGGPEKLFQQLFGNAQGEKLLKPYACYISTSVGPIIGTLYVSTKRLAFCSDYPLNHYPFSTQNHKMHYKVVVQLDQLSSVNPSTNRLNPTEKYIQLVTVDDHEFFFMGFIAHDKAFKTINEALQQYHNHSRGNSSAPVL